MKSNRYILFLVFVCFFIFNSCQSEYVTKSLEYPGKCSVDMKGKGSLGYVLAHKSGVTYTCGASSAESEDCTDEECYPGQNATIFAINDDCEVKWKYEIGYEKSCNNKCLAIGEDGNILFTQPPNTSLYSLSSKGKLNWTVDLGLTGCYQMAIGSDGIIYVMGIILSAVSQTGEILWNIPIKRTEGPIIGPGDNIIVAHIDSDSKFHLSSISKEGQFNWDYDFGTDELPDRAVIGPSGNTYIISIVKKEGLGYPGMPWYSFNSPSASGEVFFSSFNQIGNLNWRVKLGEGEQISLNSGGFISGLLVDEDETIYTDYYYYDVGLKAINYTDGSVKWQFKQPGTSAVLEFIDGQGNVYFLGRLEGKVFNREGDIISSFNSPGQDNTFGQRSVMDGDYFVNVGGGGLSIYHVLGSGYSKSAWPMLFHDPQNTNRWNGGS